MSGDALQYLSTRGATPPTTLSDALAAGLAPDGGLYVPARLPTLAPADFAGCDTLPAIATRLLAPFFAGDALAPQLAAICSDAFTFDAPLVPLATPGDYLLELFHGPTAAFKDFGARFLAACLRRLPGASLAQTLTILVATSGDTGAAVGAAFAGVPEFRVLILYPDGRVSPRQAHQLGAFGGNVAALRVAGAFDDCQRLVKQAFADAALRARVPLSSANSISLGRLLPQMSYYAAAALAHWRREGTLLNLVVPTGNLGNALAAVFARACGLPLGRIALATNANATLRDFFAGHDYAARASIATLANAMDVGAPSNFERLAWLYPDPAALRREFAVDAIGDDAIRDTIRTRYAAHGAILCPHTATAVRMLESLRQEGAAGAWAAVATAHAAKFDTIVEPLIGRRVDVPPALAALLARPSHADPLPAEYPALRARIASGQAG